VVTLLKENDIPVFNTSSSLSIDPGLVEWINSSPQYNCGVFLNIVIIALNMTPNRTLRYFSFFIKRIPDLTGKERKVLLGRLRKKTLVMIGKSFAVTEGRIRQIEKTAIRKIKSKNHQLALFRKSHI
jgi:hypothetical protein